MEKRKLDICICTKNRHGLILKMIDMIEENLTGLDYNIIVSDDKSTDRTMNDLLPYQDKYNNVVVWQNEGDGYVDNYNFILSKVVSDYFCLVDDDDIFDVSKFTIQAKYLDEHPDIDVVSSTVIFPNKQILLNTLEDLDHKEIETFLKNGEKMSSICHFQSCMFRKHVLEKFNVGEYFLPEYIGGLAGEGFLYKLFFLKYKFNNIKDTVYLYTYKFIKESLSNTYIPLFAIELDELPFEERKKKINNLYKKHIIKNTK